MADTSDSVRSETTYRKERGMNRVLAHVHPRQFIWVLLVALIVVLGWQGSGYISRLETVEKHIQVQNGTLKDIQLEQRTQKVNMEWVVRSLGGTPAVTPLKDE